MSAVIRASNLGVRFGAFSAVSEFDLEIAEGESHALIGESGCGKTTVAKCILGLQAFSGELLRDGRPVRGVAKSQAKEVGVVWQDPLASLDPRWRVGDLIREPGIVVGEQIDAAKTMELVGLDPSLIDRFPHQLSGGQRQRVAIARAIGLRPKLVICDEPTSALDLSVQAQVLNLLRALQAEIGCALLFISHDLATVQFVAKSVSVMYAGRCVERGTSEQVFQKPRHPYTQLLLKSALDPMKSEPLPTELPLVEREVKGGCAFAPRCPNAQENCWDSLPVLDSGSPQAECHYPLG